MEKTLCKFSLNANLLLFGLFVSEINNQWSVLRKIQKFYDNIAAFDIRRKQHRIRHFFLFPGGEAESRGRENAPRDFVQLVSTLESV